MIVNNTLIGSRRISIGSLKKMYQQINIYVNFEHYYKTITESVLYPLLDKNKNPILDARGNVINNQSKYNFEQMRREVEGLPPLPPPLPEWTSLDKEIKPYTPKTPPKGWLSRSNPNDYEEDAEGMSRRKFLKRVGKGVAVLPTIPGNLVKNAAQAIQPAVVSTTLNLNTSLLNLLDFLSPGVDNFNVERFMGLGSDNLNSFTQVVLTLKNALQNKSNPIINDKLDKLISVYRDAIDDIGDEPDFDDDSDEYSEWYFNIYDYATNLLDNFSQVVGDIMDENLISVETGETLLDFFDRDVNITIDPIKHIKWAKRNNVDLSKYPGYQQYLDKHPEEFIDHQISYSRMDTAGGSEDEGYAKYYEKFFNHYVESNAAGGVNSVFSNGSVDIGGSAGALQTGDTYAPGDMRVPKVLGAKTVKKKGKKKTKVPIQRRAFR